MALVHALHLGPVAEDEDEEDDIEAVVAALPTEAFATGRDGSSMDTCRAAARDRFQADHLQRGRRGGTRVGEPR